MKRLRRFAAGLLLATGFSQAVIAEQALPEADAEAIYVVEQYLGYLVVGDVQNLKQYLATSMTKHRTALLKNPEYSSALMEEYAGASTEIVASQQLNPDEAQVDARILYPDGHTLGVRFMLGRTKHGYRIASEY